MARLSTPQIWVRNFCALLLVAQVTAFAACAAGYFKEPLLGAILMITLIINLCVTAFQFFGKYEWEDDCEREPERLKSDPELTAR